MAYTVNTKRSARKAIRAIPQKKLRRRVEDAIEGLADDPRPVGSEKLSGTPKGTALWRVKEGAFRIVYEVRDDKLVLLVVQSRRLRSTEESMTSTIEDLNKATCSR